MENIDLLIEKLTLEEKTSLVEGYKSWMSNKIERLNIPSIFLTDGPLGVRKKKVSKESGSLGLGNAYPSTVFPSSVNIANSFNKHSAYLMGKAIGEECVAYNVHVLLGPALNIKRDPRCGRNFEYYSEDPLLSGIMAGNYTLGIQENNVAACMKHFALNNSENYRYVGSSEIDLRAAFEIYLKSFEICNYIGHPKTVMCAYNKINGIHCSENKWLIEDVLRNKWGYDGLVMTDWGATVDRVKGIKAGIDLDMPGEVKYNKKQIIKAIEENRLNIKDLNRAVKNVLKLVLSFKENEELDETKLQNLFDKNEKISLDLALDSAVLLKNDNILPLNKNEKVLVVGELFEKMRYQGAGSSNLNPVKLITPKIAFDNDSLNYTYLKGYKEFTDKVDENLEIEVIEEAKNYDKIIVFAGLTEMIESEGFDRNNLSLPKNQLSLIEKLSKNNNIIIVLFGGGVVELPFGSQVKAILNMFLPGQCGGEATKKLLYGEVSPSGKLSETWMKSLKDIPFYDSYSKFKIEKYKENIFVGYRYFDYVADKIQYPFGFGLSYTNFNYTLVNKEITESKVSVTIKIENVGNFDGSEVIQLYVKNNENSKVFKAIKELKAFEKTFIKKGESNLVTLSFNIKDLAYYNTKVGEFIVENGKYEVCIGSSSQEIKLSFDLKINNQKEVLSPYEKEVNDSYKNVSLLNSITDEVFLKTLTVTNSKEKDDYPFSLETPLKEFKKTKMGNFVLSLILKIVAGKSKNPNKEKDEIKKQEIIKNKKFMVELIPNNCLRSLLQSSGGMLQMNIALGLLSFANGKIFKAIYYFLKPE